MSKPIGNLFLKQILADISSHANEGRLTVITEGKKHKKIVREANPVPPKEDEEKPEDDQTTGAQGPNGSAPVPAPAAPANADKGASDIGQEKAPAASQEAPSEAPSTPAEEEPAGEDSEQAQADAAASKAELEKAKAEKDQAEKEIKKQSYVHLVSPTGVFFLLQKLVDHAFKTNTIDSLAAEMAQKLKIANQEDFSNFSEEMIPYKAIPGVAELLVSIRGMAASQPNPETDDTTSREENT